MNLKIDFDNIIITGSHSPALSGLSMSNSSFYNTGVGAWVTPIDITNKPKA